MFIIICFASVFMSLCEFAFINFIDIFIRNHKIRKAEEEAKMKERLERKEAKVVFLFL